MLREDGAVRRGVRMTLVVVRAGIATSVQDRGRRLFRELGVGRSGAIDTALAGRVNRLVGNGADAAVLETAGGLSLRTTQAHTVATSSDGVVRSLPPGSTIEVSPAPGEAWGYLAVRGGIAVAPVLGSRSWDSLGRLGPVPPADGDELAVGDDPVDPPTAETAAPRRLGRGPVRVWDGPQADWFDGGARALADSTWTVSAAVSRVGSRLDGPVLARGCSGELATQPLIAGAVQVPPDGQPIVMLADHPTTGGYPVIAVVDPDDIAIVAQSPPGATIVCRRASGRWR